MTDPRTAAPPPPPTPPTPTPPAPGRGPDIDQDGLPNKTAAEMMAGLKPNNPPDRPSGPVWPGHPAWCTCTSCTHGTPPPGLEKTEVSREVVGTRTLIYWSDGTVTWAKAV